MCNLLGKLKDKQNMQEQGNDQENIINNIKFTLRKCNKCGINKTIEEFHFERNRNFLHIRCNSCRAAERKLYKLKNREKILQQNKEYYRSHREQKNAYYLNHKDKWKTISKERKQEINKKYREKNKIFLQKRKKQFYHNNIEKIRLYNIKNNERIKKNRRKYIIDRQRIDMNFKLRGLFARRILVAIKNQSSKKSLRTTELLGCSIQEARSYLESQFKPGMTWENHGRGINKWNIDHIIPCASFDLTKENEQRQCFHYSNLQPLWEKDHKEKTTQDIALYWKNRRNQINI